MKKKGMELQINFIVTLIIVLAIFGSALMLTLKFFKNAETLDKDIKADIADKIDRVISQGQKVVIPDSTREVQVLKSGIFGVGILNYGSSAASNEFRIQVSCTDATTPEDSSFTNTELNAITCYKSTSPPSWNNCFTILPNDNRITIDNYKKDVNYIKITSNTNEIPTGSYKFKVYVCRCDVGATPCPADGKCNGLCDNAAGYCGPVISPLSPNRAELYDQTIQTITMIVP